MSFRLVDEGWISEFEEALRIDSSNLKIICPFIKSQAISCLLEFNPNIRVITRYKLEDFALGVSDIAALQILLRHGASIRGIRNLHSKLYIFGQSRAIVTSANLTKAGLCSNPEFGIVTEETTAIDSCHAYFDKLWDLGRNDLQVKQVNEWDIKVSNYQLESAKKFNTPLLVDDFGADAGLVEPPRITQPNQFLNPTQAFVKFIGASNNRVPPSLATHCVVKESDCHRKLAYPKNKRPRGVREGAVMYIARFTEENSGDIRVFGRAIGKKYLEGRDDATKEDLKLRPQFEIWSRYIRVHGAEILRGELTNAVSLNALMYELGTNSFSSTQRNAVRGEGNVNPRKAYNQQSAVELSFDGCKWLGEQLQKAFNTYGTISKDELSNIE